MYCANVGFKVLYKKKPALKSFYRQESSAKTWFPCASPGKDAGQTFCQIRPEPYLWPVLKTSLFPFQ